MNIGLIGMKCDECGSRENTFDEILGERVCSDCGLVLVQEMFEETVSAKMSDGSFRTKDHSLGSVTSFRSSAQRHSTTSYERTLENGYRMVRMVFNSLGLVFDLNERMEQVYRDLYSKGIFRGATLETRATAVVYFCLKENRTPVPLDIVCGEFDIQSKLVKKLVRKISKIYQNVVIRNDDGSFEIQRICTLLTNDPAFLGHCLQTYEFFEKVMVQSLENKRKTHNSAIVFLTAKIHNYPFTSKSIANTDGVNVSSNGILVTGRRLLSLIGLKRIEEIIGKDLEKLL